MRNKIGYKIYKNSVNNRSLKRLFNSFLKVIKFCGIEKNFKNFDNIKNWQSPELHKKLIIIIGIIFFTTNSFSSDSSKIDFSKVKKYKGDFHIF